MQLNIKTMSFFSKNNLLEILFYMLLGILSSIAYCYTEEVLKEEFINAKPKIVETGDFNGRVIDAVTGDPIENAIVIYRWDVNVALYETTTDKDGKYFIPNQSIEWEPFSRPEHEEVIIYKFGYLWYSVDEEGLASFFMTYVPDLVEKYTRKNNIVRLQPWIDEFSHLEHIDIFERNWDYPKVPELEEALQRERVLAENSKKLEEKTRETERETHELNTASKKNNAFKPRPGTGMIVLRDNKTTSANPAETRNSYGSGIMALGGKGTSPKIPRETEERKIQAIRNKVRHLCADYKRGNMPEDEYKERLYEYLEISDYDVLGNTAKALKELNDHSAIPVLIDYLKENIYRKWNFNWALSHFRIVTGRTDLPERINVISERVEIVQDIEQWWQRNEDKSENQWLHDLVTNGKTDSARIKAMAEIRGNKDNSALPSVLQCLNNEEDSSLYEQAILTLVEIGDQSVIPDIKKKLYHENVYVRRQSALALNKLGDKTGIPVMIASLDSPSENTRSVSNAVLREITTQDFSDSKSLRQLPMEQQQEVIQSWKQWWQEHKGSFKNYYTEDISSVLKTDDDVLKKYHLKMIAAAQKNPEAPRFKNFEKTPEACLEEFKTALANGEIDKAVSFLSPHIRTERKELFGKIGPEKCRDFAKGMGPVLFNTRVDQIFYYEMITETDEGVFAFPINFVKIDDGEWIIQDF